MIDQDGRKAPSIENIKPEEWNQILELPTKSARRRYYQFLWSNEMKHASAKAKKETRRIETEERLRVLREEEANNDHITYGLLRNTMFLRIYDATITHWHNQKLIRAMQFEQKLIIDCSYDEYMNNIEATNTGKQLMLSFAENRLHDEPFDLHFCNVNFNTVSIQKLNRFIPTMVDKDFPMNIHTESITEKFDKDRLVYLTPHCFNDLEYSNDDIYIVGAIVDKVNHEPLSLAKAKKQGLRIARLPLAKYLQWSPGSGRSLTINQMVTIMLEMKKHGDWNRALRHVPRRKLAEHTRPPPEPRQFSYEKSRFHQKGVARSEGEFVEQKGQRNYNPQRGETQQRFDGQRNFQPRNFNPDRKCNDRNFNPRDDDEDSRPRTSRPPSQERRHFDKYQFDLNTWGSKIKKTPKTDS